MSAPTGTDDIQLHFCHVCGVSIPQPDIEAGLARTGPDTCAICSHRAAGSAAALVRTPDRPASAAASATAPGRSASPSLVSNIAILYVVCATTFLLVRELTRDNTVKLPGVARAADLGKLADKLNAVDTHNRKMLDQLKSNDNIQRRDLWTLNKAVNSVQRRVEDHVTAVKKQQGDLQDSIVMIGERTLGLTKDARDILRKIDDLEGAVAKGGNATNNGPTQPPPTMPDGKKPDADKNRPKPNTVKVDPETRKQANAFVKQLLDRNVDKQTRFNAAVQLGDLMDPSTVPALRQALKKDSYDLVRRAAAYSLGMLGKHSIAAIPDLIDKMDDKEEYVGYMCERALSDITKVVLGTAVSFGFDPTMNAKKRREVQKKWQVWWEKNRESVLAAG